MWAAPNRGCLIAGLLCVLFWVGAFWVMTIWLMGR